MYHALTHICLGKANLTSSSPGSTHFPSLPLASASNGTDTVHQTQLNSPPRPTTPNLERGDANAHQPSQRVNSRGPSSIESTDDSLRSRRDRQICYRNSMVVCFLIVTILVAAQAYLLGQSAYIKVTKPVDACTDPLHRYPQLLTQRPAQHRAIGVAHPRHPA